MRKGLIALALFGLAFLALMLFAPRPAGDDTPPRWTGMLGRLLGGWAPRVRDLGDKSDFALTAGEVYGAEVFADRGKEMRLLTLRREEGGPALVTFVCRPTPAEEDCDGEEEVACLGQPLDPACGPQIEKGDPGDEVSFVIGPGGGRITIKAQGATRIRVVR